MTNLWYLILDTGIKDTGKYRRVASDRPHSIHKAILNVKEAAFIYAIVCQNFICMYNRITSVQKKWHVSLKGGVTISAGFVKLPRTSGGCVGFL